MSNQKLDNTQVSFAAGALEVKEVDGAPDVSGVTTIRVSNGTLTDDGSGQVTITTGGGGGTPGGSDKNVQYNNAGAFGGVGNNATATNKFLRQVSSATPSFEQAAHVDLSGVGANDHHNQSHDHSQAGDGTTLSPATLNLPSTVAPAQTTDGQVIWDSDDNIITVGDGAATKQFGYLGSTNPSNLGTPAPGTSKEVARVDHVHNAVTGTLTVKEEDGTPSVANVTEIKVTNGTLTDNGSGSVSINIAGGGAPTTADYWVETAQGGLSAEVVVGTTGITTAAEASVPAAAKAGRLFFPSDGIWIKRDTGAAWAPWGPIFPMTDPALQTFAWINQNSATITTTFGGVYLAIPAGAGVNVALRKKVAPATPYTVTAAILLHLQNQNYNQGGLMFRQSSDGKLVSFGYIASLNSLYVDKYTNPTTFSANYTNLAIPVPYVLFLRIADDGVNRICSWSVDGQNFRQLHSVGRTDFLTADEVGCYVDSQNASWGAAMTLLSWKEA